ncbi:hypothetical protein OAS86_05930 [Gammaproteobacteria bacterium]|nr:hypothetical protein [Gammaproteobacteria bacterium]
MDTSVGFIARLLINETPFPGESSWISAEDTQTAMLGVLNVIGSRIEHVPPGYTQRDVAAISQTSDPVDIIAAGGPRGQCDGFFRDDNGHPAVVPRVEERLTNLLTIAGKGQPGRFSVLLDYAVEISREYLEYQRLQETLFVDLRQIGPTPVTGYAFAWMTDQNRYHPGGRFIKITDANQGSLGGNRFFTLKKLDNG